MLLLDCKQNTPRAFSLDTFLAQRSMPGILESVVTFQVEIFLFPYEEDFLHFIGGTLLVLGDLW